MLLARGDALASDALSAVFVEVEQPPIATAAASATAAYHACVVIPLVIARR